MRPLKSFAAMLSVPTLCLGLGVLCTLQGCTTGADSGELDASGDLDGTTAQGQDGAASSADGGDATLNETGAGTADSATGTQTDSGKGAIDSGKGAADSGKGGQADGGQADSSQTDSGQTGAPDGGSATAFSNLDTFTTGGTISLGSGKPSLTVTVNANGSRTATVPGPTSTPRLQLDWTSGRAFTLAADTNGDGVVDEQRTVTSTSGTTTSVWEIDRSLGGAFDWQNTVTRTNSEVTSTIMEVLPLASAMVTTSSYTGSAFDFAPKCVPPQINGSTCKPTGADQVASSATYCQPPSPSTSGGGCGSLGQPNCITWIPPGETWTTTDVGPVALAGAPATSRNAFSTISAGGMQCDAGQAGRIAKVVAQTLSDLDDTMIALNVGKWAQVLMALCSTPLYFGCALPPSAQGMGIVAVTNYADFADDGTDNIMITAIDPSIFAAGDNALEEIIAHEWFHVAGDHHPHDPNGWLARDQIYSCARSMNGGKAFNDGFYLGICCEASSARDHTMCADADNKAQFGIQNVFVETADAIIETPSGGLSGYTNKALPPNCADDSNQNPTPCLCELENIAAYCDQTIITEPEAEDNFGIEVAALTLREPNCCESCDSTTPYSPACGTVDQTSPALCPPMEDCTPLPNGVADLAAGPTPPLRNPTSAFLAGQIKWAGNGTSTSLNCPAISGYSF